MHNNASLQIFNDKIHHDHIISKGPLTRYVKLWIAHALGVPGRFSPPTTSKETLAQHAQHASRHVRHAHALMHVGIANLRWPGKRSWHSRHMRNPQFYVSGKRPIERYLCQVSKYRPSLWSQCTDFLSSFNVQTFFPGIEIFITKISR